MACIRSNRYHRGLRCSITGEGRLRTVPSSILLIRNDKIGDFVLSLPCFALLKNIWPSVQTIALVPEYTRPLAEACPWIDEVIIDPGAKAGIGSQWRLVRLLRQRRPDAQITLFSTTRIGLLTLLGAIPSRLAPATKLAQLFYRHTLRQRRSQSLKPEYEYNLDLVHHYISRVGHKVDYKPNPPYLRLGNQDHTIARLSLQRQTGVEAIQDLICIHPGSGGSANNLSGHQYAELASLLTKTTSLPIVLTAGPGELEATKRVQATLLQQFDIEMPVFESREGLLPFVALLATCRLFIGGSTGPLHIAAAMNTRTVGFYPASRVNSSLRWQTLNDESRRLAFCPPATPNPDDMSRIDLSVCCQRIHAVFLEQTSPQT